MISRALKIFPMNLRQEQTSNIIFITFWSQFSVYALNTILILFLTRPLLAQGLGYDQAKAYAFIGVSQATNYLMPMLGGYMADTVVGIRRSILLGSIMLACAYLLVMLSGYTLTTHGDYLFIAAYAFIPATNSLLMGTASSMVSHIYSDDAIKAKSAMTYYYMAINLGALLATWIAPVLLESAYGPLSVLTISFIGKSIAALNFAKKYSIYTPIVWGKDKSPLPRQGRNYLLSYLVIIYLFTLLAFSHVYLASIVISIGCGLGMIWFLAKTLKLSGDQRIKQSIAILLIIEAIVFFVIYNQMNSTLVLFANSNSNHNLLGFTISAAQYQILNPLLILFIGSQLPTFYRFFTRFTIPYQFASGTFLAGLSLLIMAFAATKAVNGIVEGNYIALTYVLISIAELWVSAIGLSMIGIYCNSQTIAFAMGIWYLANSLSNTISGRLAVWVSIPEQVKLASESLPYYQHYYFAMGLVTVVLGLIMYFIAFYLHRCMKKKAIILG